MGIEFSYGAIFFHHKIFVNGKQIFLNEQNIKKIKSFLNKFQLKANDTDDVFIKLSNLKVLRNILGNSIHDNDIFLISDKEISKNEEENFFLRDYFGDNNDAKSIINIYCPELYVDENIKTNFSLYKYDVLETNEKFNVLKYSEQKFDNDNYYSILLIGKREVNELFINGFLNFLFNIKENDKYRLKLDTSNDDENNDFNIETRYIHFNKINFKFNLINMGKYHEFDNEKIKEFINFLKKEKKINIIVFNNYFVLQFNFSNYDIIDKIIKAKDGEKTAVFFICMSTLHFDLKLLYLQKKIKLKDKLTEIYVEDYNYIDEKLMKETIIQVAEADEELRQYLISCNFDYSSLFNEDKNKNIAYSYKLTMEGYEYFYNILKEREKAYVDFSLFTNNNFYEIRDLYNYNIMKQTKTELDILKNEIEKEKNRENILDNYDNEIRDIKNNLKNDENIYSFLIPLESSKINNKPSNKKETVVCNICKYNCYENFKGKNIESCKLFQSKFKRCINCPNKCPMEYHEIASYKYKNNGYKKYDEMVKEIKKIKTKKDKCEDLEKQIEKFNFDEERIKNLEKKSFDNEKLKWYDELFLEIFNHEEPKYDWISGVFSNMYHN